MQSVAVKLLGQAHQHMGTGRCPEETTNSNRKCSDKIWWTTNRPHILENFKWPKLCNGCSDPLTFGSMVTYLKSHSLSKNDDSVFSATLPDSHTPYQPIRSLESVPRRQMSSGEWPSQDEDVPVIGQPPPGFTRSAVTHMGVTETEALQLAEDRPFWWTIATAGGFG